MVYRLIIITLIALSGVVIAQTNTPPVVPVNEDLNPTLLEAAAVVRIRDSQDTNVVIPPQPGVSILPLGDGTSLIVK